MENGDSLREHYYIFSSTDIISDRTNNANYSSQEVLRREHTTLLHVKIALVCAKGIHSGI